MHARPLIQCRKFSPNRLMLCPLYRTGEHQHRTRRQQPQNANGDHRFNERKAAARSLERARARANWMLESSSCFAVALACQYTNYGLGLAKFPLAQQYERIPGAIAISWLVFLNELVLPRAIFISLITAKPATSPPYISQCSSWGKPITLPPHQNQNAKIFRVKA